MFGTCVKGTGTCGNKNKNTNKNYGNKATTVRYIFLT